MGVIMKGLSIYLIVINLLGYGIMGYDKWRAKKNKWRVEEQRMFLIALFGGGIGIWFGMQRFRHKTLHKKFVYGIPAIVFGQFAILIFLGISTYLR